MFPPLTGVCRHLIMLNVLMFFGTMVLLGEPSYDMDTGEMLSLGRMRLSAFFPGSTHFEPFQLFTHMFMHGDLGHIFFNMISLYIFGPMIESVWGPRRFLFYYLFCGIGAYALYMGVEYWTIQQNGWDFRTFNGHMLGASGAVFGLYAAFGAIFPEVEFRLLFPPIPIKGKYFVMLFGGLEIISGVGRTNSGVAHYAHIGGALFGMILLLWWFDKSRKK